MDILQALGGAVIGFSLPYIARFGKYVAYDRWREHRLEGTWYTYHYTEDNEQTVLRYEEWSVSKNVLGTLVVKSNDPQRPKLKYKGKLTSDGGYVLFDFRGINHNERFQARFWETVPGVEQILYGFFLGVDFGNRPLSTIWMAARSKKADDEARALLQKHASYLPEQIALRMTR